MPEKFTGEPCVRWPPFDRSMPRNVSPGLRNGGHRGVVRLRAGVRLHVRVLGAEQLLGAIDRQLLDLVHDLAAAVVALSRQSLGVLVRERRPHRLEHGRRHEVLARDQLEPVLLPARLVVDQRGDLGIRLAERVARGAQAVLASTSRHGSRVVLGAFDLLDAARVAPAFERRVEPGLENRSRPARRTRTAPGARARSRRCAARASLAISGFHATAARTCGYRLAV